MTDNKNANEPERRSVTLELIRKRSEHHEGLLSELTHLDLHQDHLESLGAMLGRTCPNLTHLYLHNNVIDTLVKSEWTRLQNLQRLSLALNNLTVLQHLDSCCPKLRHLDVSFNFISLRNLQLSLECLQNLQQLQYLFLKGNPCERQWKEGIFSYVATQLPQLQRFDDVEIVPANRKETRHEIMNLQEELQRVIDKSDKSITVVGPEVRAAMSRDWLTLQQQRDNDTNIRSQETKAAMNLPLDHQSVVTRTRKQEKEGERRNCNEGDFQYGLTYEQSRLVLQVMIPRSLTDLDLDVQSTYVSLVANAQVLRLQLSHAIQPSKSEARRSQATGRLELIMPLEQDIVLPPSEDETHQSTSMEKRSLMAEILAKAEAVEYAAMAIKRIGLCTESCSDEEPPPFY
jgi:protein TilB